MEGSWKGDFWGECRGEGYGGELEGGFWGECHAGNLRTSIGLEGEAEEADERGGDQADRDRGKDRRPGLGRVAAGRLGVLDDQATHATAQADRHLGNDRADDRRGRREAQRGDEERHAGRQSQAEQRAPPADAVRVHEVDMGRICVPRPRSTPTATGKNAKMVVMTATECSLCHSNSPIVICEPQRRTSGAIAMSGTVWLSTTHGSTAASAIANRCITSASPKPTTTPMIQPSAEIRSVRTSRRRGPSATSCRRPPCR